MFSTLDHRLGGFDLVIGARRRRLYIDDHCILDVDQVIDDERKRVEMRFAHLKTHHRFERMRLRGLTGARDEFHLAAVAQNLKTLANRAARP